MIENKKFFWTSEYAKMAMAMAPALIYQVRPRSCRWNEGKSTSRGLGVVRLFARCYSDPYVGKYSTLTFLRHSLERW